jgi:hypothetical protein
MIFSYLDCFALLAMTTNAVRHCEQSEAIQKYYILNKFKKILFKTKVSQ